MSQFAALKTRADTCGRVYQIRPTCWCVDLILELVILFIIFPLPIFLCFLLSIGYKPWREKLYTFGVCEPW